MFRKFFFSIFFALNKDLDGLWESIVRLLAKNPFFSAKGHPPAREFGGKTEYLKSLMANPTPDWFNGSRQFIAALVSCFVGFDYFVTQMIEIRLKLYSFFKCYNYLKNCWYLIHPMAKECLSNKKILIYILLASRFHKVGKFFQRDKSQIWNIKTLELILLKEK